MGAEQTKSVDLIWKIGVHGVCPPFCVPSSGEKVGYIFPTIPEVWRIDPLPHFLPVLGFVREQAWEEKSTLNKASDTEQMREKNKSVWKQSPSTNDSDLKIIPAYF